MSPSIVEKLVYFGIIFSWYKFLSLFSGACAYHITLETVYFKERTRLARKIYIVLVVLTALVIGLVTMSDT